MLISVQTHLAYSAEGPCNLLLQIEAAQNLEQKCSRDKLTLQSGHKGKLVSGEENIGVRRWIEVNGTFECEYRTLVRIDRPVVELEGANITPVPTLPSDVIKFLMPSRYCHPEDFLSIVPQLFDGLSGGRLVAAMSQWITENFTSDNAVSHASTTASDSFAASAGVCRDYAHVLIAMARAVGIPARFVSAYAPDVIPQDFHAVAEVYLDHRWHLVDPTGMAQAPEIVQIGVGRDAADVSFMTSYGWMELKKQTVQVLRVGAPTLA